MKILDQNKPVNIVCYGDSNTKYYLGDLQQDGPEADSYPAKLQSIFLINPVYLPIKYVRVITLDGNIPSIEFHLLMLVWAAVMVGIGALIYKKCNHKFLYYV